MKRIVYIGASIFLTYVFFLKAPQGQYTVTLHVTDEHRMRMRLRIWVQHGNDVLGFNAFVIITIIQLKEKHLHVTRFKHLWQKRKL